MTLSGRGNSRYEGPEAESCLQRTRKSKEVSVIGVECDDIRKAFLRTSAFTHCKTDIHWKMLYGEVYNILVVSDCLVFWAPRTI